MVRDVLILPRAACARIASLIEAAKLNGVEPCAWLDADLLAVAAAHPDSRIDEPLQRNFADSSSRQPGASFALLPTNDTASFRSGPHSDIPNAIRSSPGTDTGRDRRQVCADDASIPWHPPTGRIADRRVRPHECPSRETTQTTRRPVRQFPRTPRDRSNLPRREQPSIRPRGPAVRPASVPHFRPDTETSCEEPEHRPCFQSRAAFPVVPWGGRSRRAIPHCHGFSPGRLRSGPSA